MERDEQGGDDRTVIRPAGEGRGEERSVARAAGEERSTPRGGAADDDEDRGVRDRLAPGAIRAEDTEPYVGLQYIARLFKIVSALVVIAMVLEIILGVAADGANALIPLLAEVVRGGVLAAILWGSADVVLLLIDLGHDVRAQRVLLGRISARGEQQYGGEQRRTRPR